MRKQTRAQRASEKLAEEVRGKAQKIPVDTLAMVAGVSDKTIEKLRGGGVPRLSTMQKIAEAVGKVKRGLRPSDVPGPLRLSTGKAWGGTTTVKAITGGRRCGFCGDYHAERLKCDE